MSVFNWWNLCHNQGFRNCFVNFLFNFKLPVHCFFDFFQQPKLFWWSKWGWKELCSLMVNALLMRLDKRLKILKVYLTKFSEKQVCRWNVSWEVPSRNLFKYLLSLAVLMRWVHLFKSVILLLKTQVWNMRQKYFSSLSFRLVEECCQLHPWRCFLKYLSQCCLKEIS